MAERKEGGQLVPTLKDTDARRSRRAGWEELRSPQASVDLSLHTDTADVADQPSSNLAHDKVNPQAGGRQSP